MAADIYRKKVLPRHHALISTDEGGVKNKRVVTHFSGDGNRRLGCFGIDPEDLINSIDRDTRCFRSGDIRPVDKEHVD
jgi:hypothetical protein